MLKALVSAYACLPDKGSESGVGWELTRHLGEHHRLWVVTRANNREAIERRADRMPDTVRFLYHDLPAIDRVKKRLPLGIPLYHYLWQTTLYRRAREWHREIGFDLGHQLTLGSFRYPCSLSWLGIPTVIGPVGGAERFPPGLDRGLAPGARLRESMRALSNRLAVVDPWVRGSYRAASATLAASPQMAEGLARLVPSERLHLVPQIAIEPTAALPTAGPREGGRPVRALFVGRLVHWKGAHLALEALARARSGGAGLTLTVLGRGPEEARLRARALELGIEPAVEFVRRLPSLDDVYRQYAEHDIFLFPSLHESGGMAVLEAMAAGLPVVCFDWGGPGLSVTDATGIRVRPRTVEGSVAGLASALERLEGDSRLRSEMGAAGAERVRQDYAWPGRAKTIAAIYEAVVEPRTS